ncbi:MAG TPA: hypothetical protein VE377_03475 [Candidatus Dormibacteraeota bacterium]|nr:hypothetical protein [Candidatus Dormibacteraeota bacterium]
MLASVDAQISGSVGRGGRNIPADVKVVQQLINANLPIPLAPLDEDGSCGPLTIFAIETYQRRNLNMNPPDGRVDPGGRTLRSLTGSNDPPSPGPTPTGPAVTNVSCPDKIRQSAWVYVQGFTKEHEACVLNMYNNRTPDKPNIDKNQDVTCGIGFQITRTSVLSSAIRRMFYDPATNAAPTDTQLSADWQAAADLARQGNLPEYSKVCHLRMYQQMVYEYMALVLKDKLGNLLKMWPAVFGNIDQFPAAAQAFCMSFAYGRLPIDFPKMRAAIQVQDWKGTADQCHVHGMSAKKNLAHKNLLLFAQSVVDDKKNYDSVPANYYPADQ